MEKRRHARQAIDMPVSFVAKGGAGAGASGLGRDISLGGICIESEETAPFGSEITIHVQLRTSAGAMGNFALPGIVRWVRPGAMGVQFGLLGVHETHGITELTRPKG